MIFSLTSCFSQMRSLFFLKKGTIYSMKNTGVAKLVYNKKMIHYNCYNKKQDRLLVPNKDCRAIQLVIHKCLTHCADSLRNFLSGRTYHWTYTNKCLQGKNSTFSITKETSYQGELCLGGNPVPLFLYIMLRPLSNTT